MADWFKECGVTSVAMEATGIYWIALFQILERRGFDVILVNARQTKNVAGRKSDVQDCQWIHRLHTYGLLQGSFRPQDPYCVVRTYLVKYLQVQGQMK
ncbi:MAG TPA: transposase [Verrucomicrobiae bacterium]|nr:transposase [Verrucomicrobiae bacterium]